MATTLTIKRNDTLSSLGRKYNVTPERIAQANGIKDPNKIMAGAKLVIPDGFDRPAPAKSSPSVGEDARDRREALARQPVAGTASVGTGKKAQPGQLERFPIVGQGGQAPKYNIGYDKNWNNFDPKTGSQNSDFSLQATNASHANGHLGVDIFAPKGQPVVAPVGGTIAHVGYTATGGNRITIKGQDGQYYYLCHMDKLTSGLKAGASIKAGAPVGTVGDSGSAKGTAPHLHFSIYKNGDYNQTVNPFPALLKAHQATVGAN
jgi:murein DD-endopeptidase MepM/ murein hydrolase activator NlpD